MNRRTKKAISFGTAIAMIAGGAAGVWSPVVTAAAPVTLTISTWDSGAGLDAYKAGIQAFEKTHPGIKVNLQSISFTYYLPKLLTEMANGSAPDLILVPDANVNEFVSSGLIANLNPLFAKHTYGMNEAAFYPNVLNIGKINGNLYFVPKDWADESVIYNKTMFQQAHVPLPKPGWTLGQFVHDAVALTKVKNGHVEQYGSQLPGTWLRAGLEFFVHAFNGNVISPNGRTVNGYLNSPATEKGIEYYLGLYRKYNNISPSPQAMSGTYANVDLFLTKRVAMEMTGPWNVNEYHSAHMNFGVAPMPIGPTGKPMTMPFWAGFALYKNTPHMQAAEQLLAFFASQKWAYIDGQWGMPALKGPAVAQMEAKNPLIKVYYSQAGHVQALEPERTLNWGKDVQLPLQNMIEAAVINPKSSIPSLIATAVSQIDSNLAKDYPKS